MAIKSRTYKIIQANEDNVNETILELTISLDDSLASKYSNFEWDSKTGLVTALDNDTDKRVIIPYTSEGKSIGTIKPAPFQTEGIVSLDYNLWYY